MRLMLDEMLRLQLDWSGLLGGVGNLQMSCWKSRSEM
jgi:hypothetical protein